uniref:Expressed protein n=2 Tax=Schizophyllum commune (strain H4-8 / FGSC 9210) TaxID=578458 RepID=D8PVC5_SCHCM
MQQSHTEQVLQQLKERYTVVLEQLASYPVTLACADVDAVAREGFKQYAEGLLATAKDVFERYQQYLRQQEAQEARQEARRIRQEIDREVQATQHEFDSAMRALLEDDKHTAPLTSALDALDMRQRSIRRRLPIQRSRQVDDVLAICVDRALKTSGVPQRVDGWATKTRAELCETRKSVEDQLNLRLRVILDQAVFGKADR